MDEEIEIQETKDKIDKEIKEIEARLVEAEDSLEYESDFFSGIEGLEKAKKRVEFEKNDLEHWKKLQKIAEARLIEIRKKKQAVPPFVIAIIDLIDAYHYADVFDEERYAWLGVQEYAKYVDYDAVVKLSDRLFSALNPGKETQEKWYELDDGYDVRVYDKNMKCVYKAHEKLPQEIVVPKVGDIIYLDGEYEMGDSIFGGKAKISDVECSPGKIFIKVEGFPELTYGWQSLEARQEELRNKFGEQWFRRDTR